MSQPQDSNRLAASVRDLIPDAIAAAEPVLWNDAKSSLPNPGPGNFDAWGGFGLDHTDHVPPALLEAQIMLESGGKSDEITDTGNPDYPAIGLGQITLNGQEVSWYEAVTGEQLTKEQLLDPATNLEVEAFGLGGRYMQARSITGKNNWINAAVAYFGCLPDKDGNFDPNCGDGSTTANQYYATIRGYIVDYYGEDVAKALENVNDKNQTTVFQDAKDKAASVAGDAASATAGYLLDGAKKILVTVLPRAGVGVAGVLCLALGAYLAFK